MVIPLTLNFQAWTKLAVSDALKEAVAAAAGEVFLESFQQ